MNFKSIIKILSISFCFIFLYGCSKNSQNNSSVCTINANGIIMSFENFADGNNIFRSIQTTKMSKNTLDSIGQDNIDKYIESYKTLYNIPGVEYKVEFNDSKNEAFVECLIIDYEKSSYDDLVEAGLIIKSPDKNKQVSLTKTIELFKSQGYSCK